MLWNCWLGVRKDIRPVKSWLLVCLWWWFVQSFAQLIAPVITTASVILSFNKTGEPRFTWKNGRQNRERERIWDNQAELLTDLLKKSIINCYSRQSDYFPLSFGDSFHFSGLAFSMHVVLCECHKSWQWMRVHRQQLEQQKEIVLAYESRAWIEDELHWNEYG